MKGLRKYLRKKEVTDQGRSCTIINVILVRKRSEDMKNVPGSIGTGGACLADFARYRCSISRYRCDEIQEPLLELNAIP